MSAVHVKYGVLFTVIAPGGFRILSAIERTARACGVDLTITSACDGMHSGPADPHHRGEAFDVRTHDLGMDAAQRVLQAIKGELNDGFFAFIESPNTDNEHMHIQVRKGATYP